LVYWFLLPSLMRRLFGVEPQLRLQRLAKIQAILELTQP